MPMPKKTYRKKKYVPKRRFQKKSSFVRAVKRVELQQSETKNQVQSPTVNGGGTTDTMSAGHVYTVNPLMSISTGNTSTTRIGSMINISSIRLKGLFERISGDTPSFVRIVMTKTSADKVYVSNDFTQDLFTSSNSLLLAGSSNWFAPVDKKNHTVLYDRVIRIPGNQITNVQNNKLVNIVHKLKYPKYQYRSDSSSYGKFGEYLIHIIPIDDSIKPSSPITISTFFKDL